MNPVVFLTVAEEFVTGWSCAELLDAPGSLELGDARLLFAAPLVVVSFAVALPVSFAEADELAIADSEPMPVDSWGKLDEAIAAVKLCDAAAICRCCTLQS